MRASLAAAALVAALAGPAAAADIDAQTMALIHDLTAPHVAAGPGADPAVAAALDALRAERLVTPSRVAVPNQAGLLDAYGRALLMGVRAPQFAREIGAVRDAAVSGDREATRAAIRALYERAGRTAPAGEGLEKLVGQVNEALGKEPEATQRTRIERPDYTIEITDARRAGKATIEVVRNAGGAPQRVVFAGDTRTRPTADGRELERRVEARRPCIVSAAKADEARAGINGAWTANSGRVWRIGGSGDAVTLEEEREGKPPLRYTGTYRLGRIQAFHAFASPDDIGEGLPAEVRAQLVGWNPKLGFTVRLDVCGAGEALDGTWSSQHVTYSGMTLQVDRVHDPYDLALKLSRSPRVARAAMP